MHRRPSERAYVRLPALAASQHALETCVFCPKLCRTTCAVSNAVPSETLTPWGKMSAAYFMARGDVDLDESFVRASYACTNCGACEAFCHHHNPVAETLYAVRAELFAKGQAPAIAYDVAKRFDGECSAYRRRMAQFDAAARKSDVLLFAGCTHSDAAVHDAIALVSHITHGPVALAPCCCGERLRAAGDREKHLAHVADVRTLVKGYRMAIVLDPRCFESLSRSTIACTSLPNFLAGHLGSLRAIGGDPPRLLEASRDEQGVRKVLLRIFANPARSFASKPGVATGGLLEQTMPHVSRDIAEATLREHTRLGGGELVTSSGEEASLLRSVGAKVVDFVTLCARALPRPTGA